MKLTGNWLLNRIPVNPGLGGHEPFLDTWGRTSPGDSLWRVLPGLQKINSKIFIILRRPKYESCFTSH